MPTVTLDAGEIKRVLTVMSRKSANIPMGDLAEELKVGIDNVIQSKGAVGTGGVWRPMSDETWRINPRRRGGRLLQATGVLANIQTKTGPTSVVARSPADYATYHITGTRKMPKRDFLAIDFPAVLDAMGDLALEEIRR